MPNIANLTLAQLRAATKAQIITAISNYLTNNFTRRQIIGLLMDTDVVSDPPARIYRADGQIESETVTDRDAETAAVVASRQVTWTYYPTGEVDTITVTEGESARTIKHYLDGHQPTVTIQAAPKVRESAGRPSAARRRSLDWLKPFLLAVVVIALTLLAFYLSR